MNSMRGRYSYLIIEANSLTVNKWQNQGQTNPKVIAIYFVLLCF